MSDQRKQQHQDSAEGHGLREVAIVQEESCCQILLKAGAFLPDLHLAAGNHCT